eukprot:GHVR01189119.1.p1 GENE.GHVR01189119.1~~GHVR01189119.1.p1  ORF type:complete len:124 (+),score=3.12 GHVR01189119.1:34-372(+)
MDYGRGVPEAISTVPSQMMHCSGPTSRRPSTISAAPLKSPETLIAARTKCEQSFMVYASAIKTAYETWRVSESSPNRDLASLRKALKWLKDHSFQLEQCRVLMVGLYAYFVM